MRLLPHRIYLMTLQGRKTLHGYPFPSKEYALEQLKRMSGQDFGYDAERWAKWLETNWRKCYSSRKEPL